MIGGWRWTAHARKRHYFLKSDWAPKQAPVHSLCGEHLARLNGMEQPDPGPDDCQTCTRKLTKEDRT